MAALGAAQLQRLGASFVPDMFSAATIRAWNMMGGIDWSALPVVAELIGIDDVELLVDGLMQIKAKEAERNG